jgi:hypothetical protein
MLLDVSAAYSNCSRAGGCMAACHPYREAARSQNIWSSTLTMPSPRHVGAITAKFQGRTHRRWHAHSHCRRAATRYIVAASGAPSDVLILDFDGVLVDSEPEASAPAWRLSACLLSVGLLGHRDGSPRKAKEHRIHDRMNPVSGVHGGVPCGKEAMDRQCHRRREGSGGQMCRQTSIHIAWLVAFITSGVPGKPLTNKNAGAGGAEGDASSVGQRLGDGFNGQSCFACACRVKNCTYCHW